MSLFMSSPVVSGGEHPLDPRSQEYSNRVRPVGDRRHTANYELPDQLRTPGLKYGQHYGTGPFSHAAPQKGPASRNERGQWEKLPHGREKLPSWAVRTSRINNFRLSSRRFVRC